MLNVFVPDNLNSLKKIRMFDKSIKFEEFSVFGILSKDFPATCLLLRKIGRKLSSIWRVHTKDTSFGGFVFLSTKPYLIRGTVDEGTTGFIVYPTGSDRNSLPSLPQMS